MTPRGADIAQARLMRQERSKVIAQVESGKWDTTELLVAPPAAIQGADLWDVLLKVPNLGRSGIRQLCERARVWPHCKLGELSPDEVQRLCDYLPERVR